MERKNISLIIVRSIVRLLRISVSKKTEHLLVQIFNFGIVGVVATIIDFLFLYLFRDICHFHLVIATVVSTSPSS